MQYWKAHYYHHYRWRSDRNRFNKNGGWGNSGPGGERKSNWNYHRD